LEMLPLFKNEAEDEVSFLLCYIKIYKYRLVKG
jgi:hypothetical protein